MPTRCVTILCVCALAFGATRAHADIQRPPRKGHRHLKVDRLSIDFGTRAQHEKATATVTYTNRGDVDIHGIAARGECGCNRVRVDKTSLTPGESGTLTSEFDTLFLFGTVKKSIRLYSANRLDGAISIAQHVRVRKGLVMRDASVYFGDVAHGESPTRTVTLLWDDELGTPYRITKVEVPGHPFATAVAPYKPKKGETWRGWTVSFSFPTPPPVGLFSAEAILRTDAKGRERITMPITANVCGPVWIQSRRIPFGTVIAGKARTASVKLRPFDRKQKFSNVSAKARLGKVRVEIKKDPFHGDRGFWRLYISVPEDAPVGPLHDEVIEVHTGLPGVPPTLVSVSGRVRAPSKSSGGSNSSSAKKAAAK